MASLQLKPEWKVEIGTDSYESEVIESISVRKTIQSECGTFNLSIDNQDGIRKSTYSLYDEVKIYYKYEDESAYTQFIGGHVDVREFNLSERGDTILLSGRSYEQQFFFKLVWKTWVHVHWGTILGDVVDLVNENVGTNFTTNFLAAIEQTTDTTDTVDIDDLYDGTEVVGQVIKPNESYLATVVVKGYKSSVDQVDDLECRLYRCKDSGDNDEDTLADVDWAKTIAGDLLGSANVGAEFITDDSDHPQEIAFQMDVPGLTTTSLYMLVFALAVDTTAKSYYLRYNTAGGYTDGDYFADGTVVSGDDLYFKLNVFSYVAEDVVAFDIMRNISNLILRDWYADTSKVVQAVSRYGASVKTFTAGENIISLNIRSDITPTINKIIVAGTPRTSFIPADKDEWTEISFPTDLWEVDYDESSTAVIEGAPYMVKVGETSVYLYRENYEANSKARYEIPKDSLEWDDSKGLNWRTKALCFWAVAYQDGLASPELARFNVRIDLTDGTNSIHFQKDVYLLMLSAPDPYTDLSGKDFNLITLKLPSGGNRRKWMDDTSDDNPELITYDVADWAANEYYITQIGFYLYANNDGVTDGEIEDLHIDGLHFILEDDNRLVINEATSQGNYDIRETIIRDESIDNYQSAEAKANLIKRLRGEGDESWTGTPGDTKDVQLTASMVVPGNLDVDPGDMITVVYANGGWSMDFRVQAVDQSMSKSAGWRTSYELAMLLPQLNLSSFLSQAMSNATIGKSKKQFAASSQQLLNTSTSSDDSEV